MTASGAEVSVDAAVEKVSANREGWRNLPVERKLDVLRELQRTSLEHGTEWAHAAARGRNAEPGGPAPHVVGNSWSTSLGLFGATLYALIETYEQYVIDGTFPAPGSVRRRSDGQHVVTVVPEDKQDEVYSQNYRCEIWIEPGKPISQGAFWRQPSAVCAILGAGNFEAPTDVLIKAFGELKVCVYKANPVNAAAAVIAQRILQPLVDAGCLAFVAEETGPELVAHAGVDEILMTGGCSTYDRIVWGAPEDQAKNKKANKPVVAKPFDAELGGVGPVVVVPGEWTEKEIEHHAQQIAGAKTINAGAVCASPQVILVDRAWPQREHFLARVRHHLHDIMATPAYYPGSVERRDSFKAAYPQAVEVGPDERVFEDQLDTLFIPDADPTSEIAHREAFTQVLAEVALDTGNDAQAFLDAAVPYCNDELFGSLCMTLLVDPRTEKRLGVRAIDDAVAGFEYGAIGVNVWGGVVVLYGRLPWGAFPKHSAADIQSGAGKINNCHLYDHAQKSVVWTPFVSPAHPPKPTKHDDMIVQRMSEWQVTRDWKRLIKMIRGALVKF